MFAFAIHDATQRRIFFTRDRAGEKPLFYSHCGGRLVFGSELKALMAVPGFPRRMNADALNSYLAFGYIPGSQCVLDGVAKLPQGHAATYDIDSDRLQVWPYWELPEPQPGPAAPDDDLVEEMHQRLLDSVRHQLIADVPVGIMLSGGLDSSLITAMAAAISPGRVRSTSISRSLGTRTTTKPPSRASSRNTSRPTIQSLPPSQRRSISFLSSPVSSMSRWPTLRWCPPTWSRS